MPVRNVPLPSIPGNFIYVKTILPFLSGSFLTQIYSDHFWSAQGGTGFFNIFTCAVFDFMPNFFLPLFTPLMTTTYPNLGFHIFCSINGYTQSLNISPHFPASSNGPALGQMFKVRTLRRSVSGPFIVNGRFTWPPVPIAWLDGNKLNATGEVAYDLANAFYMNPWSSQGRLMTPCTWSRKTSSTFDITELKRFPFITHDRKSRRKDGNHSYAYVWPQVF
jgi:hypothetical protein